MQEEGKKFHEIAQSIDEQEAEHKLENCLAEIKVRDKLGIKSAVISFYKANDRALKTDVAPTIMQREKQPSEYSAPTIEEIEKIAKSTENYRDEFLIWFLQSTGVRRTTASLMTFQDMKKVV